MTRLVVYGPVERRRPGRGVPIGLWMLGGLAAGFVVRDLAIPALARFIRSQSSRRLPSLAELVHDAQQALSEDADLATQSIDVVPVARGMVGLRGWVDSRRLRARAHRIVCDTLGSDAVIDSLMVRGEDDAEPVLLDITA